MAAHDDEVGACPGDARDDAGLGEGVRELGDCYGGVGGGEGFYGVEKPGAGLGAVGGAVVAVVEADMRSVMMFRKEREMSRYGESSHLVRVISQL